MNFFKLKDHKAGGILRHHLDTQCHLTLLSQVRKNPLPKASSVKVSLSRASLCYLPAFSSRMFELPNSHMVIHVVTQLGENRKK